VIFGIAPCFFLKNLNFLKLIFLYCFDMLILKNKFLKLIKILFLKNFQREDYIKKFIYICVGYLLLFRVFNLIN